MMASLGARLGLWVGALRFTRAAQQIRHASISTVSHNLLLLGNPGLDVGPQEVSRVVTRVVGLLGRLPGWLDSCLVRTLVAAALLASRHRVVLHIGFAGTGSSELDGHAWLSVDGCVVPLGESIGQLGRFEKVLDLPVFEEWTDEPGTGGTPTD